MTIASKDRSSLPISLIVEQHVTTVCNDMGLLAPTTEAVKELLDVERIDAVADMGYHKSEDIEVCEAAGITPYLPRRTAASMSAAASFSRGGSAMIRPPTPATAPAGRSSTPATAR